MAHSNRATVCAVVLKFNVFNDLQPLREYLEIPTLYCKLVPEDGWILMADVHDIHCW